MLARNAERVYWLGRYVERIENTARLLNAFSHVMMDLPQSKKLRWDMLLKIMSSEQGFTKKHDEYLTENIITFLLVDADNPGSIRSSVKAARENARTCRDIIPLESWEVLNELNLLVKRSMDKALNRRYRYQFIEDIIGLCQQFNGMIYNTLSRNQSFDFLIMGNLVERADMTTRILDVAAGILLRRNSDVQTFDTVIWSEILKATSALTMYRTMNGPRISPENVLYFMLCEEEFPRSMKFCLSVMRGLVSVLPRNESFCEQLSRVEKQLALCEDKIIIEPEELHIFFDEVQKGLSALHNEIANIWFLKAYDSTPALSHSQTQTQTQT
ncbi:MAG: Unknown protein [uncultured Thiotrichaceae bacterium]|uniref:DUF403 domain-containing protein n=1 Tax=uncultured Thiotrichaceae bacterium TaxID=298394 RepID=A0A6S6U288_9GAMM|nr:MAG: Unknown protein [uncultured Thiotrichaceae bacterium]